MEQLKETTVTMDGPDGEWTGALDDLFAANETIGATERAEMRRLLAIDGEYFLDCGPGPMVLVRAVA